MEYVSPLRFRTFNVENTCFEIVLRIDNPTDLVLSAWVRTNALRCKEVGYAGLFRLATLFERITTPTPYENPETRKTEMRALVNFAGQFDSSNYTFAFSLPMLTGKNGTATESLIETYINEL